MTASGQEAWQHLEDIHDHLAHCVRNQRDLEASLTVLSQQQVRTNFKLVWS